MNIFEAKSLLKEFSEAQNNLDHAVELIKLFPPGDEKEQLIRRLGSVITAVNSELIFFVCEQYPDLNPYKDG